MSTSFPDSPVCCSLSSSGLRSTEVDGGSSLGEASEVRTIIIIEQGNCCHRWNPRKQGETFGQIEAWNFYWFLIRVPLSVTADNSKKVRVKESPVPGVSWKQLLELQSEKLDKKLYFDSVTSEELFIKYQLPVGAPSAMQLEDSSHDSWRQARTANYQKWTSDMSGLSAASVFSRNTKPSLAGFQSLLQMPH